MEQARLSPQWKNQNFSYWFDLWVNHPRDEFLYNLTMPAQGEELSKHGAMFLAHAIALKGVGCVSPNPLVGAVLLDASFRFLSAGAHLEVGSEHAEVNALKNVSITSIAGAHLFVTLEPCAHQGRTPSCAQMLARTNIASVTIGAVDPFVAVNGQGINILNQANIRTELLTEWNQVSSRLAKIFFYNQKHRDVYVGLKVASSPSGVFAGEGSSRLWITGERARQFGHFLRLEYDAIVIGPSTVLLDDPSLNVRHKYIKGRTPLRVVLDPKGELATHGSQLKVFDTSLGPTVLVSAQVDANIAAQGVTMIQLPLDGKNHFDWADIKSKLWDMGVRSLLIEGGDGLYSSAIDAGIVNEIHWFVGALTVEEGRKWHMPSKLKELFKKGGGVSLGEDKLIEVVL